MRTGILYLALAVLVSAGAATALAQKSSVAGVVSCSSASAGATTMNVSGYLVDVQAPPAIGSSSSGAGAGKANFSEAEVEVPASDFSSLMTELAEGQTFATCVLTPSGADGIHLLFHEVAIADVELLGGTSEDSGRARNSRPAVRITFEYASLQVESPTQGTGSAVPVSPETPSGNSSWGQAPNGPSNSAPEVPVGSSGSGQVPKN